MFPAGIKVQIRCFALSLMVVISSLAQDRGTVRGTVTDQSGAAVPDAVVTARNIKTCLTQITRSGVDGVYNIPYLPVGDYSVSTEKIGFRKAETTGVRVDVNSVVDLDMKLTV